MLSYILLTALAAGVQSGRKQDDPLTLSCSDVMCPENLVCVYGPKGPTCAKEGKCPAYRLDIVGICKKQCTCDQDCKGEEKCCFNGCVNRCFRPILPTIVTCATMSCDSGYACTDYPSGGACEPIERAGTCPALPCRRPRKACKGGKKAECSVDTDCKNNDDKCCTGCDGCVQCVGRAAPSSCDNMFCSLTTACVKDKNGPKCVKDIPKSGHCPLSTCSSPGDLDLLVCKDKKACVSDVQCDDSKKCCKDCRGCGVCVKPPSPPSCRNKKCKKGEVCALEWVPCKTPPCPLQPKCDKPCLLPKEEGVCVDKVKSWYFDLATRRCVMFMYGGCEGNNNRFSDKTECAKACIKNVKCPDRGPKPPCLDVNECALSAKGNKPLCPTGKACCPTKCGTRCFKPVY
ncbi:papilin-like [Littorina saxatilis]|uniref:Uncharacterized protein n=1 Tax=Littorina saxatilis TaxID=31220 RepID=A0AAN9GIX5_9CAEN